MERCPNCRARLEADSDTCRRCGIELTQLQAAAAAAEAQLRTGVARLARGERDAAAAALRRALAYKHLPLAEHLLGHLRAEPVARAEPLESDQQKGLLRGLRRGLRVLAAVARRPRS